MTRVLGDYLDMTLEAAKFQWKAIESREWGHPRQPWFEPVETILCFALFYLVDPHRYGGKNIHTVPAEIHQLGALFRRSSGSVTSKMLNLDGSRANAGAHEVRLCVSLWADRERFTHLYRITLKAARSLGIHRERLPDFLLLEDQGTSCLPLLGQEKLDSIALDREIQKRLEQRLNTDSWAKEEERETERMVEQQVRVGQHRFAALVLQNYENRCGFCGFDPGTLLRDGLIVASHIKPWADSNNKERLDIRNGIAACAAHDRAFDRGLLTVNGGLRIHRAESLAAVATKGPGERLYGGEAVADRLLLPPTGEPPGEAYLQWHNKRFRTAG